jgi:penicillin-binding protein 1A
MSENNSNTPPGARSVGRLFGWRKGRLYRLFTTSMSLGLTLLGALTVYGLYLAADMPDLEGFDLAEGPRAIIVADRHGVEIGRRGGQGATPVSLGSLPAHLPAAVLAVEDRRFHDHIGIDLRGTTRAMLANMRAGDVVQGGSTLTQQLAKNLFLDPERSLNRKAREAMLALWLESRYEKHQLLEAYLNRVYFGGGAWGVEQAAQRYFGKSAREVTLAESAILAGLLKAPNYFSPVSDARRAEARANVVLKVMLESGAIDKVTHDNAQRAPVRVLPHGRHEIGGHFVDAVVDRAQRHADPQSRIILVTTTLDLAMQRAAENAVRNELRASPLEASLVALEGDGSVRAMVGGKDYRYSQFNRAIASRRQVGSLFKSFVYLSAIEAGISPVDLRVDEPIALDDYAPRNFDREFRGPVAINRAFADSVNIIAVKLAEEVGRERVANTAERLGLADRIRPHRSMPLGTMDLSAMNVATGYLPFANQGFHIEPQMITEIRDDRGAILYERPTIRAEAVLADRPLRQITELMAGVVEDGTGKRAQLAGREVAGKTGTSDDSRDGWFAGFVPGLTAVVWVGDDDNRSQEGLVGGGAPARIWQAFMTQALVGAPVQPLYRDRDIGVSSPLGNAPALEIGGAYDIAEAQYDSDALARLAWPQAVPARPLPVSDIPSAPVNVVPAPSVVLPAQSAPLTNSEYNRGDLEALISAVSIATEDTGVEIGGESDADEDPMDRDKLNAITTILTE